MDTNFFSPLENTRPFLKMALEGFAGSGKTYTSAQIATGIHKLIKSDKPIVIYDTEKAAKALNSYFKKQGISAVTKQSRTLADLTMSIKLCEEGAADILIIDSITHVWENFLETYKRQKKRDDLYFNDWGIIKPKWKKEFSDLFVNANCHIIFTGRAGFEYEESINEKGKKELTKSGIKMKSENETAYEPDLLVLMERQEDIIGKTKEVWRTATVLKDRTTLIDGQTFKNPSFKNFSKAVKELLNGEVKEDEKEETPDKFESREDGHFMKKKNVEIALEEIKGALAGLGINSQSKDGKAFMVECFELVFDTASWTKIELLPLDQLQLGAETFKSFKRKYQEMKSPEDDFDSQFALAIITEETKSETLPFLDAW